MQPLLLLLATPGLGADVQADLHLDTPTQLYRRKALLDGEGMEAALPQLREGGTNLAVEVLWPPRDADWEAHASKLFDIIEAEDRRLDAVSLARSPAEARSAIETGGVALVVSMEGAHGIDRSGVEGLRRLHARGLRMLGLTWSFSNRFAGSSGDGGGGLSADGWALLTEANRLGVMVDVSHASDRATMEACGWSHAPVVASHSNTDGRREHGRNLSDAAIRCIARGGGVIGVNVHGDFVGGSRDVAAVADHFDHLRSVGGAGVVALGSDYDGLIKPVTGLEHAGKLAALWGELRRRGWTDAELAGARGENFMRAWTAVERVSQALQGKPIH
ncbi:MAG: membrane dipeptidase [Deltaproteobacteria bacterium]|nr:membrane dipeptidase [Deltaproteobacteria bacterium]